ncbi:hypothetical protein YC2023_039603 [Brassica napus]
MSFTETRLHRFLSPYIQNMEQQPAGKAPLWLANAWGKCQDGPNVRVVQDTYNAMRIRLEHLPMPFV